MRRTATESRWSRVRKKLTSKTSWYKKQKQQDHYKDDDHSSGKKRRQERSTTMESKTVLFVEYSKDGELAKQLRELMARLAPVIGFGVKIVERADTSLRSKFPLTTLWDGTQCGRTECIDCNQGAEVLFPCTRSSLVYENTCLRCNQGAGGKKELQDVRTDIPTVYIGETSHSLQERGAQHWGGWKRKVPQNHMVYHQNMEHGGEPPKFILRPVSFFKSALTRQIAEAVRIRRRGGEGSILNSKSEYNRCHIPRLQLEEQEQEEELKRREQEEKEEQEQAVEEQILEWEQIRTIDISREQRKKGAKLTEKSHKRREQGVEGEKERKVKRRKFKLLAENWGDEEKPTELEEQIPSRDDSLKIKMLPPELAGGGDNDENTNYTSSADHQVHPSPDECIFENINGLTCITHACPAKEISIPTQKWQ